MIQGFRDATHVEVTPLAYTENTPVRRVGNTSNREKLRHRSFTEVNSSAWHIALTHWKLANEAIKRNKAYLFTHALHKECACHDYVLSSCK